MSIDWGNVVGPETNPPTGPTTPVTQPIANLQPAPADKLPGLLQPGQTQEDIDKMSPWDRAGRGIDIMGQALFGRGNGSLLGGVPLLGDLVGSVGNAAHLAGDLTVVKPIEAGASGLSHIPLGWLPGGADENFNAIGDYMKANDPEAYQTWLAVKAASDADFLGGGNMKADFNIKAAQFYDDQTKEGFLGKNPLLAMGRAGVGSLGGALSNAIQGWLGLPATEAQRFLGDRGFFDPNRGGPTTLAAAMNAKRDVGQTSDEGEYAIAQVQSGKWTEEQANQYLATEGAGNRSRIQEAMARYDRGATEGELWKQGISTDEKFAVEQVRSGAWSEDHANNYLISKGQSITRNPVGQTVGGIITDPLMYATIGAGSIAKAGAIGKGILESGVQAETTYQKLATIVAGVQQSNLGPAFRIARGLIDPLAVYKPNVTTRALTDLKNGVAVAAFGKAYGAGAVDDIRAVAREAGMTSQVDSAIAAYSLDQADLMIAKKARASMMEEGLGADLVRTDVDSVVETQARAAGKDALDELTDHMYATAKNTFTPEEKASLAGRMTAVFGNDTTYWTAKLSKMSGDVQSGLHAVTYKMSEKELAEALAKVDRASYTGKLPLDKMVLMTSETLDDVTAEAILAEQAAITGKGALKRATDAWNAAGRRYPGIAAIGHAPGGKQQLNALIADLKAQVGRGAFSKRALPEELGDPALSPVRDMLDRHTMPVTRDGVTTNEPLWHIGFRPDEEVAWGLRRDPASGRWMVDRDPTISHVMDAVPGRQPFSDTVRNGLGQIIGKRAAGAAAAPIDSMEAFLSTTRDVVTGRRLVLNMERRFEKTMFEQAGVPKPVIKDIFEKAREVAGLDHTTLRGLAGGETSNLWKAVQEVIPTNVRLPSGHALDVHTVMDHLLTAAEGDMRIMGVTSVLTQRMRNTLRRIGIDPINWTGQMTVTMYNKLRYSQPTFLIQRVTDAPYYGALYGVTPMGKGALKGQLAELRAIEENMARTGVARDFSMDMPEYATRSNFTGGLRTALSEKVPFADRLQKIVDAPDAIIANNMTAQLHSRLGSIVRGVLDDTEAIIKDAPPELQAEMRAELEGPLSRSFADWRATYSQAAGRALDDNEVGLKYVQEMLGAARRVRLEADKVNLQKLIHEGERSLPSSIGEIGPIRPDDLAVELGYENAAAMRKDLAGTYQKIGGQFVHVPGERDLAWLEEHLAETLNAHPDYIKRASAYFGGTWEDYWHRLSLPVESGGLDISSHYAKEAQDLISRIAADRGMDPWEYLSGVMSSNIGAADLNTTVGQLMGFLKAGASQQPLEAWTKVFRAHLDVSAQRTLLEEFENATGVRAPFGSEAAGDIAPAAFTRDARGNAVLPAAFKHEPGAVYRIETLDEARGGWPARTGVTEGTPHAIYASKDEHAIFRFMPADGDIAPLRSGVGTAKAIPPERIEMLGADGAWHPLTADPYDALFEQHFPEMVRQRILDGVPHPNPEVEGYMQQFSKWVQAALGEELGARTRSDLRRLVESVPTENATPFNRTHALVVGLLKDKINDAQTDIFRLAEMATKRSVLERSLNHPLFGLYPASYMWSKVLPETIKFLAKNPYAATYTIANVQRSIATQREYDRDLDATMEKTDRSSTAFLLDYLTPGLPWSDHSARMSPMVRDLFAGKDLGTIWADELATVDPQRWLRLFADSASEVTGLPAALAPSEAPPGLEGLNNLPSSGEAAPSPTAPERHGPVQGTDIAPILADDLIRLQEVLGGG